MYADELFVINSIFNFIINLISVSSHYEYFHMNLFGFNKLSFYFIDLLFQYLLSYLSYSIFLLLKFIKLSCFHIILLFLLILDTLNFIFPISLYLPPFLLFLNVFYLFILNISQFLKLKLCYYVLLLKTYQNNLNIIDINL